MILWMVWYNMFVCNVILIIVYNAMEHSIDQQCPSMKPRHPFRAKWQHNHDMDPRNNAV